MLTCLLLTCIAELDICVHLNVNQHQSRCLADSIHIIRLITTHVDAGSKSTPKGSGLSSDANPSFKNSHSKSREGKSRYSASDRAPQSRNTRASVAAGGGNGDDGDDDGSGDDRTKSQQSIFLPDIIGEDDDEESTLEAEVDAEALPVKRRRAATDKLTYSSAPSTVKKRSADALRLQNERDRKKTQKALDRGSDCNAEGAGPDSGHNNSKRTQQGSTAQQCQLAQGAQPKVVSSSRGRQKCRPTTAQKVGSGHPPGHQCTTITIYKRTSGGSTGVTADSHVTGDNSSKNIEIASPEVLDASQEASCALAADEFMRRSPTFFSGKNVFLQKNFTY